MPNRLACSLAYFVCVACAETAVAPAAPPTPPDAVPTPAQKIPDAIAVPSNTPLILKATGKGVQIYRCGPKKDDANAFEWTLKAPEAELFNDQGQKVAKHYAGPSWESPDGSKVVGQLKSKVDAPDATSIPWLLLDAKSTEGDGVFSKVKAIQRVETKGGKAPKDGCDAAHLNAEVRVDYQAAYYFYGAS